MGFVIRAGLQILASYPRLYWNDHCIPGAEWIKFTKKVIDPKNPWIAREQEEDWSPLIAQPGNSLGLGRHWHFVAIGFWILNGLVYVVLLFASGGVARLIPTSWSIFPESWDTFIQYVTFNQPPATAFNPFDPLQQLAYAAVILLISLRTSANMGTVRAAHAKIFRILNPWLVSEITSMKPSLERYMLKVEGDRTGSLREIF